MKATPLEMEFIGTLESRNPRLPHTLIVPALSIGNVGQLAADALISSGIVSKVGYLDDPYILPCVGNDPFGPEADGELALSLEVFENFECGLAILQQRSPVIKGKIADFAEHVAKWAEDCGVREVVILSGLDSSKRQKREMTGPQIQYISTSSQDGSDALCDELGWKTLEQAGQLLRRAQPSDASSSSQSQLTDDNYFAGLPFASLYCACKARGLKVFCILSFCSEGDNIPDAIFVAESVHHFLQKRGTNLGPLQWRVPLSWATVYGPAPDDSIF